MIKPSACAFLFMLSASNVAAESIPLMIPYSGTVNVNSAPFNGSGQFRFAIINGHADCLASTPGTNCVTHWSNDSTSVNGNAPSNALSLPVTNGQFSVKLGDISLMNTNTTNPINMPAIPLAVFNNSTLYLRVWFDDGSTGVQRLAPDRQLVAVPFAYRAEVANSVSGAGVIRPGQIALDAVGSEQIVNGSITGGDVSSAASLNITGLTTSGSVGLGTTPQTTLDVKGQGNFSRDGMTQCCAPADAINGALSDFTQSVAEATRNDDGSIRSGRRATIQFHNGNEAEGFIRLASGAGSQPVTAPGSLDLTTSRFIFGSYQSPIAGEFTGDLFLGKGRALNIYDTTGTRYARLIHSGPSGNLHLDPMGGGDTYINWHGGSSVNVGNGSGSLGNINAAAFAGASSKRFKKDIEESRYGLREVLLFAPKYFRYIDDPSEKQHIGLIAEDVDGIVPQVVQHDPTGAVQGIDYGKLSVVLISAIKELSTQNGMLTKRIESLEGQLNR